MGKRGIIVSVLGAAVLCGVVLYFLGSLFSGSESANKSGGGFKDDVSAASALCPLSNAVPSDAAVLMSFDRLDEGLAALRDSTKLLGLLGGVNSSVFGQFVVELDASLDDEAASLKKSEMLLSRHFSGKLEPLLLIESPSSGDEVPSSGRFLFDLADTLGLHHSYLAAGGSLKRAVLMFSTSETLLSSAKRHHESGISVLDKPGLPSAICSGGGKNALYINHEYIGKLTSELLAGALAQLGPFVAGSCTWSAWKITSRTDDEIAFDLTAIHPAVPSFFMTGFEQSADGEVRALTVAPYSTVLLVDRATSDASSLFEIHKKYLDATTHLDKFAALDSGLKKAYGIGLAQWVERLNIKEFAKLLLKTDEALEPLLLLRPAKQDADIILKGTECSSLKELSSKGMAPYAWKGVIGACFGNYFRLDDESVFTWQDGWMVIGSERAVGSFLSVRSLSSNLKTRLTDASLSSRLPAKGQSAFVYASLSDLGPVSSLFKPPAASYVRRSLSSSNFAPLFLSAGHKESSLKMNFASYRKMDLSPTALTSGRDTSVVVPRGPFRTQDPYSGEVSFLSQGSNLSISLKDGAGKGIWAVPFKERIAGAVECIDYYSNEKSQFLFAGGSKLYLLDRKGRFVNPFPVELGRYVLYGPKVFNIDERYLAAVLHSDNSIGLYYLDGTSPDEWLGISHDDRINALPELVEAGGRRFWIVRTVVQTLVYPFEGGEPLTHLQGGKMIAPDSKIEINDKASVSYTALDGKSRSVKLR